MYIDSKAGLAIGEDFRVKIAAGEAEFKIDGMIFLRRGMGRKHIHTLSWLREEYFANETMQIMPISLMYMPESNQNIQP